MGTFTEVRFIEVGPSPNRLSPSALPSLPPSCSRRCSVSWSWSPSWHSWLVACTSGATCLQSLASRLSCLTTVLDTDTALVDSELGECHTTAMVLDSEDTGGRRMLTPPTSGAFQIFTNVSGHPDPYMGVGGVSVM